MIQLFHVERIIKALFYKGFLVFIVVALFLSSCIKPQHTIEIQDYTLLSNGKPIVGNTTGLTAFMFENNPRKIPFNQFVVDKYQLGSYNDVEYFVDIDGARFKVYLYENAELEKYFVLSDFMVTKQENEANIKGSTVMFIGLSMTDANNNDCLADNSLYRNIATNYLKKLKDEFNNL